MTKAAVAEGVQENTPTRKDIESELSGLKDRIELARNVKPTAHELHCEDCFQRGRDAALRIITAKE